MSDCFALVTWLAAWRLPAAAWSFVEARFCSAAVMAFLSWSSVCWGAPDALSDVYCAFASVTACLACLSLRLFCATVLEYEDRAFDSWVLAEVTWSLACARAVAVPPAASVFCCAFAAARLASAWRTASSALVSSATASTSPAFTRSPTATFTAVTGHVTVTDAVPVPVFEEAAVVAPVAAVEADEVDDEVAEVPSVAVGVSPKARS